MVSNDDVQTHVAHTTDGDYTTFTITTANFDLNSNATNLTITPYLGVWKTITYVSHDASKGLYNYNTNTWTISELDADEEAILTLITQTSNLTPPTIPSSPVTINSLHRNKLIGQPVILDQNKNGMIQGSVKSMQPTIGGTVLVRKNDSCGNITTGQTSDHYTGKGGQQFGGGMANGINQCTDNNGETNILCPGDPTYNEGTHECYTEPPANDCMRYTPLSLVREPRQYELGISGGKYYYADFGLDPVWIYPPADKPLFMVDVNMAMEPASDLRGLVPDCWPGNGLFNHLNICVDENGNQIPGTEGKYNCKSGCCMWPGDTDFTTLYSNVCPGGNSHSGQIWKNRPGEKFQFWYPYGGLWIYIMTEFGGADPGNPARTPSGWKTVDCVNSWNIINGPDIVLGVTSGNNEDNYNPSQGGKNTKFQSKDQCIQSLQGQGLTPKEIDDYCQAVGEQTNQDSWTECMRRLYIQNPDLTEEELSTMCNEHPGWTSCMINEFYASGETKTEEELIEDCKNNGDNYTIKFHVGLNQEEPFPIYGIMFYIGGTSACTWGWPGIPLLWTEPVSNISNLRFCTLSEEELDEYMGMRGQYEEKFPNYNNRDIRKDHCIGDDGKPIPGCTPKK